MAKPFRAALLLADNRRMLGKLLVVALLMFGFGYALVPMYERHLRCARHQRAVGGRAPAGAA